MSSAPETHFEWLARLLGEHDRRGSPFRYRAFPPPTERRRWDLRGHLAVSRNG